MKQYAIDELRPEDHSKIRLHLDEHFNGSNVDGLYWVPIRPDLLSEVQARHPECQPFYFGMELEKHRLVCELLVRTQNRVRCSCMAYATETQRNWLISYVDGMIEKLGIIT